VVAVAGSRLAYVTCGCIRSDARAALPARLAMILADLTEVIAREQPTEVAVEKVFVNVNPQSTLLLGQARGAAISAAVQAGLPVAEYTALQVKQAVVGHGKAAKEQVQEMVKRLFEPARHPLRRCRRRARLRDRPRARRGGSPRHAPRRLPRSAAAGWSDARAVASAAATAGARPTGVRAPARGHPRHGRPDARHRAARRARLDRRRRAPRVAFDHAVTARLVGRNFADCTALIRAHHGEGYPVDDLMRAWHGAYDAIVGREGIALKPGLAELLTWLDEASIPKAVATSTRRSRAQAKLVHTGLAGRFAALVGGDEIARGKPAPDIYVEAAGPARRRGAGLRRTRGFRAGDSRRARRRHDADHGARLAPPSPALLAHAPLVLASLFEVRAHLAALPLPARVR